MMTDSQSLIDLLQQLYEQGIKAAENRKLDTAIRRYIQCLTVMSQMEDAKPYLLTSVLFNLGKAAAYRNRVTTATDACQAAAAIAKQVGRGEAETDSIYLCATVVLILDDYPTAHELLQLSLQRYRQLGLTRKAKAVQNDLRSMIDTLGEVRYRQLAKQKQPDTPFEFVININDKPCHRLTVTREGDVTWVDELDQNDLAFEADTALGWEIQSIRAK